MDEIPPGPDSHLPVGEVETMTCPRIIWLIPGIQLVIAPDTGPVHIARAWDVPVIGLYGHTNPWRWGPYRKFEDLWVDRYTDPGTEPDARNAMPKLDRMTQITVADVLERVQRAIQTGAAPFTAQRPPA